MQPSPRYLGITLYEKILLKDVKLADSIFKWKVIPKKKKRQPFIKGFSLISDIRAAVGV